ncbi:MULTISPECIES: asparaginase [unclassified Moraxella]|uniref:asparaginase n=1 Tax=unclassified Moraxella TaxID=2685852 RepID=UPI003AF94B22
MSKKNINTIGIIYAGGTFGSYGQPLQALPNDEFLPILTNILSEHFATYLNHAEQPVNWQILPNDIVKDSSQLTPSDFAHFYQLILQAISQGIRQFVLLTGTDTLSYLGAFLAESFANSNTCIIVTGAMQPLLDSQILTAYQIDPHSDATQNLFDACKLARHGEAGVRVAFSGEHWHAQTVQKIHSHDLMAFVGHHRAGYPATSYSNKVTASQQALWLEDKLAQLPNVVASLSHANIIPLYLTPMSAEQLTSQLQQALANQPNGLILLGFGAGNVPVNDSVKALLKQAKKDGCLVVISTQCPFGGVSGSYEAGAWLEECGVLTTGRLTVPAIFARLLWLTANFDTPTRRRQRWTHCIKDANSVA